MGSSAVSISLPELDRESGIPIYQQIERHFVDQIRRRHIPSHTPVLGAVDLAEQLGISHLTVRQSYKRLVEQGLLYSIRGKGTFVAERQARKVLGVAVSAEFIRSSRNSGVYAAVAQTLHRLATEHGYALKMIVCTTPYARQVHGELDEMDRAALEEARLYGLFVSGMALPDSVVEELADRGVWMVSVPSDDTRAIEHKVVVDRAGMLSLPVQYAQSKGVQRPGVIYLDLEDRPDRKKKILTVFAEHGYELNPAHVVGVSRTSAFGGQLAADHLIRGYRKMDALICYDDLLAQGVCAACIKHGVNVPDDLLVIAHANKEITPPYLVPAARISVDVMRMARLAFDKLICLIERKDSSHIPSSVEPTLIPERAPVYVGEEIALNLV
ncbi:MAG: substrate-binding domain-containing protein [Phycisphaerales bacterium]|nr:substrate-binding domain-containing protein [Phycisphaerales bacterium]